MVVVSSGLNSDDRDAYIGAAIFLIALVAGGIYIGVKSRDPNWRRQFFHEVADALIGGVLAVGLVLGVLYVAFAFFEGWMRLWAIAGELVVTVLACYVVRWSKYPGIFQSKSSGRLMSEVALSSLLIFCVPLLALLARLHVLRFIDLDRILVRLGLSFKHKKGEIVQVSLVAPPNFLPGGVGRVEGIIVVAEDDLRHTPAVPFGSVFYEIAFPESVHLEVPEKYLS